jgi:hypothetical protein
MPMPKRGSLASRSRVGSLRQHNDIAVYREGERAERGEATLDEAADSSRARSCGARRRFRQ